MVKKSENLENSKENFKKSTKYPKKIFKKINNKKTKTESCQNGQKSINVKTLRKKSLKKMKIKM